MYLLVFSEKKQAQKNKEKKKRFTDVHSSPLCGCCWHRRAKTKSGCGKPKPTGPEPGGTTHLARQHRGDLDECTAKRMHRGLSKITAQLWFMSHFASTGCDWLFTPLPPKQITFQSANRWLLLYPHCVLDLHFLKPSDFLKGCNNDNDGEGSCALCISSLLKKKRLMQKGNGPLGFSKILVACGKAPSSPSSPNQQYLFHHLQWRCQLYHQCVSLWCCSNEAAQLSLKRVKRAVLNHDCNEVVGRHSSSCQHPTLGQVPDFHGLWSAWKEIQQPITEPTV